MLINGKTLNPVKYGSKKIQLDIQDFYIHTNKHTYECINSYIKTDTQIHKLTRKHTYIIKYFYR